MIGFGPSTPVAGIFVGIGGSTSGTVTAADGSYSLAVPQGTTTLTLSGQYLGNSFSGTSASFVLNGDRTENVYLPPPTRLAATVKESDGTPAYGALVHRPEVAATGTSSSGLTIDYDLAEDYCQVPDSGWCDLYFFAGYLPYLEITGPGRSQELFAGETFPVGTVDRTYTLASSALLRGTLRRSDGQAPGSTEVWWDANSSAYDRTSSDGTWSIRTSSGRGRLHLTGTDLDGMHQEPYEYESDAFDLTGDRTENLTLPALGLLRTVVQDSLGHEVAGAHVTPIGSASVLARSTDSGLPGTFYLRRSTAQQASCETEPVSGACEIPVFRGGTTAQVAVTPPGGSLQQFPVGVTLEDVHRTTVRLFGYANVPSVGSATGPVLVTTSPATADFASLAAVAVDLPDGVVSQIGRLDYRITVSPGGLARLRVQMPPAATPNSLVHVGPDGALADVTADGEIDGHQFDLSVVDGGAGDEDRVANGVITGNVVPVIRTQLTVETTALPPAATGVAYETRLTGSGPIPPYTWSTSDALPPGLSLSADGVISGTPTTVGTWRFDVEMRESTGSRFFAVRTLTLTVATVVVTSTSVPDAYQCGSYSARLKRAGGGSFATWRVVSGALPPGMTLASGGTLSGRPTSLGTYRFGVTVTSGGKTSPPQALAIVVRPMEVATTSLPDGTVARWYSQQLTTNGGKGPLAWSLVSGSLPPKLKLGSGGRITGTPSTRGSWTFAVRVTDSSVPRQEATRTLTLIVG
jgi:hypothetical protein